MGGAGAACQALGPKGYPLIKAALKKGSDRPQTFTLPSGKRRAVLAAKKQLTPTIWQMDFELEVPVDNFAPGQFARLRVGDYEWRDYSIAGVDGAKVRFLISTRTGGHGSQFVIAAQPGTKTECELPLGDYTIARNPQRKIFIATGTGLAPFLPMFRQLERDRALDRAELYFGCRTAAEDITAHFDPMPATVVLCISREEPPPGGFKGRVSEAIVSREFDLASADFYVCGSAAMVANCRDVLQRRGARQVHIEPY
jgi:NAD(P)H-flavin reductase